MTGLEIGFLVLGVICIVASFFFSEKLSSSDLKELQKMSEKEISVIMERQLREADEKIETSIQQKLDHSIEVLEAKTDRQTNEKLLAIGEVADPVLESIDKSHQQVMFMYDMLVDKQEKLTQLTADLQKMESDVRIMKDHLARQQEASGIDPKEAEALSRSDGEAAEAEEETPKQPPVYDGETLEEAFRKEIESQKNHPAGAADNQNDRIVSLYEEGSTEVEIAKELGIGLGEVKLVLGLFVS